jgi:hypothetical protein
MKISRLLTYAAAGVIAGLLIENQTLIINKIVSKKARQLSNGVKHKVS